MRSPALFSLLFGALAALGFAPLEWWLLTVAGLAGWLFVIHAAPTWRAAAVRGWLFGVGHFAINNNWIQHAFDFQDAMPPVLGYVAPILLALYLALFPMAVGLVAWRWRGRRPDTAYALVAGAAWIAGEWLRGRLFTGYPWDPIAAVWVPIQPVAGLSAWIGTYALSGLTVTAAGLLLAVPRRRWPRLTVLATFGAIFVMQALSYRTAAMPAARPSTPRLIVVQPDIGNAERGLAAGAHALEALVAGSGRPGPGPRLVMWPEGLVLDLIEDGYPDGWYPRDPVAVRRRMASALGPRDTLLTNVATLRFGPAAEVTGAANSVLAVSPAARIAGRYDKAHLVPYGEYLPMRELLEPIGLARLVPGSLDFDAGPGPRNIMVPGFGAIGIQICYEIVFSGAVVDRAHRPRLIFNPSNDAWFGRWGPPQHLAQARLRAIEEGLPVVRATPTGISAVIAADGRVVSQQPLGTAGTLDVPVPDPLPPTLFARIGNLIAAVVAALLAVGAIALRRHAR